MTTLKKIAALAGLIGFGIQGSAHAQLYVHGFIGVNGSVDSDFEATLSDVVPVNTTATLPDLEGQTISLGTNADAGSIYGGAIGYNFDELIFGPFSPRVELEYSQSTSEVSELSLPSNVDVGLPDGVTVPSADREIKTIALRGILEIDTPIMPIDPYFGASVGLSQIDNPLGALASSVNLSGLTVDDATTYGIFGGAMFKLPAGAAIFAEVRYTRIEDAAVSLDNIELNVPSLGTMALVTADINATTDINTVSGLAGVRWEF